MVGEVQPWVAVSSSDFKYIDPWGTAGKYVQGEYVICNSLSHFRLKNYELASD
jgi:hypothetical protein